MWCSEDLKSVYGQNIMLKKVHRAHVCVPLNGTNQIPLRARYLTLQSLLWATNVIIWCLMH